MIEPVKAKNTPKYMDWVNKEDKKQRLEIELVKKEKKEQDFKDFYKMMKITKSNWKGDEYKLSDIDNLGDNAEAFLVHKFCTEMDIGLSENLVMRMVIHLNGRKYYNDNMITYVLDCGFLSANPNDSRWLPSFMSKRKDNDLKSKFGLTPLMGDLYKTLFERVRPTVKVYMREGGIVLKRKPSELCVGLHRFRVGKLTGEIMTGIVTGIEVKHIKIIDHLEAKEYFRDLQFVSVSIIHCDKVVLVRPHQLFIVDLHNTKSLERMRKKRLSW